ncbi:unnamed protein product [Didymodactylos carnosus]|uniref:E3 ubiquitin-protein ligase n=1 Tax=Didymodactylos carnosus TaxID=1234261 RepID=A0A8S2CR13_9BILA|nr:unnamed protein product [Didymodactylos carnosus]CAF3524685.1 unnamed protein product [Didymodactylos carnosus]
MNDTDSADMSDDDDFGLDNDLTTANSNEQTPIIIEDLTTAIDISVPEELQQFDSSKFAQDLLSKVGTSDFQTCLYQHWRRYTPLCYTYHPNLVKGMIELRAQDILFRPLEIFLYGTQDTENAIQTIKGLNNPPTVCGHLFKSEEPTYFCRDCCVDATCVLCTECFLQSEHRKHRYKMNVSAGGGYCDCGDTEAWKQDVHCALHKPKNDQEQDNNDILERLPNLLKIRAGLLFEVLLNFSVQLLCCGDYQETPVVLRNDDWDGNHDRYVTMLFNDEIHTYDQVIAVLTRSISCSKQEGHEYASVVDREGRTAVRCGNLEQCQEVQQMIMHHTVDIPLKCRVYPKCFVSLQYFAQKLMLYMQEVIAISDGFRRLFCLCEMNAKDQLTLTERILLAENVLWKSAKSVLHQIFINSFFMDSEWKKTFAILYMKNYSTIWRNYVKDHDEYVSFTDLSVQVYTVPSLARYLISSHNAFQTIVEAFLEYCRKKLNCMYIKRIVYIPYRSLTVILFSFEAQEKLLFLRTTTSMVQNEFRRAQSILYDLKYLLGIVPTQYTPELRENFLNGFTSFLRLLSYMHGMDKVVRQVGQHIEFEPEWETGFNIVIKIQTIIQSILEWCSQDPELSQKAYVKTGETLASMQQNSDISHMIKKDASPIVKISVHDHKIECYSYDVQKDPISVHIPVARLLAAIYIHLQRYTDPTATFHNLCQQYKIYPCFFYEEALRIQVLSAQHIAGLWRRNGYSLSNQLYFYSNIKCRKEMYDRDILALQIGASLTQPNTFLVQLLHKFGLLEWVRSPENGYSTETETKTREKVRIMEEFLHLLIIILGERYEPYVGQVMKDEKLKREIIHQLCTGPLPHSELVRNFTDSGQEVGTVDLESVLKETADFKKLSHTSKGHYELKNDCLIDYNPFYYHYTKADQCRSEEYVLKRRKILGLSSLLLIPSPPAFYDSFQSIIQLLQCDIFLTLIKAVLHRTIDQKAELWSEAILIRALHLITLALFEEERSFHKQQTLSSNVSSHNFQFCENSQKYGIEKLLTQLTTATKAETCKEFVSHILKSFNKFNEKQNVRDEQSSSLTVSQDFTNDTNKKAQKEKRRKELAAQKRAKIIAQMTALQKNFMEGNKDLFDEAHISTGNDSLSPSLPSSLIATPVLLGTESGMTESMDTK